MPFKGTVSSWTPKFDPYVQKSCILPSVANHAYMVFAFSREHACLSVL